MTNHTLMAGTAVFHLTPFAMAKSADHFFRMASSYDADGSAFLPRLHIFGNALEIGLKAAILVDSCTAVAKRHIQYELRHDLRKVRECFENIYNIRLFDSADDRTLDAMNDHYRDRAYQFFTTPMLGAAMTGYKSIPPIGDVERSASKVVEFLAVHDFFVSGNPLTPEGGRNAGWPALA